LRQKAELCKNSFILQTLGRIGVGRLVFSSGLKLYSSWRSAML